MLQTVNPAAVERAALAPLPAVGTLVLYWPRPSEARRGHFYVPALVMWQDAANRQLDLLVFQEAHDLIDQTGVREHVENERGWSRIEAANGVTLGQSLSADVIGGLEKIILGDFEPPERSVMELLDALDERLGKIEEAQSTPTSGIYRPKPGTVTVDLDDEERAAAAVLRRGRGKRVLKATAAVKRRFGRGKG